MSYISGCDLNCSLPSVRYSKPTDYDAAYEGVKAAIFDGFYGPADKGIYSPSVQFTLYDMARIAIKRCALSI